jgi:hypothetical protein
MDPNVALTEMLNALTYEDALENAVDLLTWLAKGGAHPRSFARLMEQDGPRLLDRLESDDGGDDEDDDS